MRKKLSVEDLMSVKNKDGVKKDSIKIKGNKVQLLSRQKEVGEFFYIEKWTDPLLKEEDGKVVEDIEKERPKLRWKCRSTALQI